MKGYIRYALDMDKLKVRRNESFAVRKGGNGFGVSEKNVCFTLNTVDRHAFAICEAVAGGNRHKEGGAHDTL